MTEPIPSIMNAKLPVVNHTSNGKINVMNVTVDQVVSDALGFPPALRAFVAEKLIESLDVPESLPLSAKWRKEVRRRCVQVDNGTVALRDADVVFPNAYASLL